MSSVFISINAIVIRGVHESSFDDVFSLHLFHWTYHKMTYRIPCFLLRSYYMHVRLLQIMQQASLTGNLNMYILLYELNPCTWMTDIPLVTYTWLFYLSIAKYIQIAYILTGSRNILYNIFPYHQTIAYKDVSQTQPSVLSIIM